MPEKPKTKQYKLHSVQFTKELKLLGRPALSMVSVTMQDIKIEPRLEGGIIVRASGSDAYEIVYPQAIACERYVLVEE